MFEKSIEEKFDSLNKIRLKYEKFEIEQDLKNELKSNSKFVIIFGVTGVGKTTLLNFLRGAEMKCTKISIHTEIDLVNEQENEKYKIGHKIKQSETQQPIHSQIQFEDSNIILIDTPGYGGSRQQGFSELEQQWLDSLILRKLLKKCKNCCFLLIMTQESIIEKDQFKIDEFYEFLKQLTGIREESELIKIARIVFNKTDGECDHFEYLKDLKDAIEKSQDQQIKFCLKQYIKILEQGYVEIEKQKKTQLGFQTPEKRIDILKLISKMQNVKTDVNHPFQNQDILHQILITIKEKLYDQQIILFQQWLNDIISYILKNNQYIPMLKQVLNFFQQPGVINQIQVQINQNTIIKIQQIIETMKILKDKCSLKFILKKKIYKKISQEIKYFKILISDIGVQTKFDETLFEKYFLVLLLFTSSQSSDELQLERRMRLKIDQLEICCDDQIKKVLSFYETIDEIQVKYKYFYESIRIQFNNKDNYYKLIIQKLNWLYKQYQQELSIHKVLIKKWIQLDNQGQTSREMYWNEEQSKLKSKLKSWEIEEQKLSEILCTYLEISSSQKFQETKNKETEINKKIGDLENKYRKSIDDLIQPAQTLINVKKIEDNFNLQNLENEFIIIKKQFELIKDLMITIESKNDIYVSFESVSKKCQRGYLAWIVNIFWKKNYQSGSYLQTLDQIIEANTEIQQQLDKINQRHSVISKQTQSQLIMELALLN